MKQGGFAAAALTCDSGKTSLLKREADTVNRMYRTGTAPVGFHKIFTTNHFHRSSLLGSQHIKPTLLSGDFHLTFS
jgi:hypothetical protein